MGRDRVRPAARVPGCCAVRLPLARTGSACGRPACPYFLRSFMRESRVRKPSCRAGRAASRRSRTSARAIAEADRARLPRQAAAVRRRVRRRTCARRRCVTTSGASACCTSASAHEVVARSVRPFTNVLPAAGHQAHARDRLLAAAGRVRGWWRSSTHVRRSWQMRSRVLELGTDQYGSVRVFGAARRADARRPRRS